MRERISHKQVLVSLGLVASALLAGCGEIQATPLPDKTIAYLAGTVVLDDINIRKDPEISTPREHNLLGVAQHLEIVNPLIVHGQANDPNRPDDNTWIEYAIDRYGNLQMAYSADQEITRENVTFSAQKPDKVIVTCDALSLTRNPTTSAPAFRCDVGPTTLYLGESH